MQEANPTLADIYARIRVDPALFSGLMTVTDREDLVDRVTGIVKDAGRTDLDRDAVADMLAGDFQALLDEVMTGDELTDEELELVSAGLPVRCDGGLSNIA